MATTPAACEIDRLPEEILLAVISGTSPCDLSPLEFRPSPPPSGNKALFMRLSASPVFLDGGNMRMWLDRESGVKCYMLPARALHILGGEKLQYWRKIGCRFKQFTVLQNMCLLEICGKIQSKMLSQNSTYTAYMVFRIDTESRGLRYPTQEASVSIGEMKSTRQVCVGGLQKSHWHTVPANVHRPKRRADNWLELKMGRFYNEDGDDDEVSFSLTETGGAIAKMVLFCKALKLEQKNLL
ncbi:hypothetical protein EJB05_28953 [Eragrostis curvula]|uniref:F-box domain-containing protein n=1 Tax=Eragrostis curvula TaxID=38414 RepID=A0A5J9UTF4_9POAL|nr:hypothetical protein EJB05_28953 [Eragrostis curvula]